MTQQLLADRAEVSLSYVEKLERGGTKRPSIGTLSAIAAVLKVPLNALLEDSQGTGAEPAQRSAVKRQPQAKKSVQPAASRTDAAWLPLRELADDATELGAWAETGTAGPGTVAMLEDEIDRLAREYVTSPPGPLILRASEACRRAALLLRQHQRLRYARDLYVVAARACAFMSVALGDLGNQAEAAAYARTALTLAEESADPGAIAVSLSALSKVAFWDGRRQQAASLAARGYATARRDDPVRVLLACQQADASPIAAARDALVLASASRDQVAEYGRTEAGLFTCVGVRLACYTATLALREGSPSGVLSAVASGEAAARDGEDVPHGTWVQLQISAALALLAAGDAEAAAGRLAPVTGLPAEMRLATFDGRLAGAAAMASAPGYRGSPTARVIAEEVARYLGGGPPVMPYPLAIGSGK
jgi:transcriptional regulator with XRE-family HTH domain